MRESRIPVSIALDDSRAIAIAPRAKITRELCSAQLHISLLSRSGERILSSPSSRVLSARAGQPVLFIRETSIEAFVVERYVVSRHPQTHCFYYVILFVHRDKWTVYRTSSFHHSSFQKCISFHNHANYICLFFLSLNLHLNICIIKILVHKF